MWTFVALLLGLCMCAAGALAAVPIASGLRCYTLPTSALKATINNVQNIHFTNASMCYKLAFRADVGGKKAKDFVSFGSLPLDLPNATACDAHLESVYRAELAALNVDPSKGKLVTSYCCREHNCNTIQARDTSLQYKCSRGIPDEVQGTLLHTASNTTSARCKSSKAECTYQGLVKCRQQCEMHRRTCKGYTFRTTGECLIYKKADKEFVPAANATIYYNSCLVV